MTIKEIKEIAKDSRLKFYDINSGKELIESSKLDDTEVIRIKPTNSSTIKVYVNTKSKTLKVIELIDTMSSIFEDPKQMWSIYDEFVNVMFSNNENMIPPSTGKLLKNINDLPNRVKNMTVTKIQIFRNSIAIDVKEYKD
jgi:hypothetical protein